MIRNDVHFCSHKSLSGASKAIDREESHSAKEGPQSEHLSLASESRRWPPLWRPGIEESYDTACSHAANHRPTYCCPDTVALRLHEKSVSLLWQLVKCNLGLVPVLVFHLWQLLLALRLVLQVRVVILILTLGLSDPHLGLLLSDTLLHKIFIWHRGACARIPRYWNTLSQSGLIWRLVLHHICLILITHHESIIEI